VPQPIDYDAPIYLVFWLFYLVGSFLHILVRAGFSVRSKKYVSRGAYIADYWDQLAARNFLSSLGFWVCVYHPKLINDLLNKLPDWINFGLQFKMNVPVAGVSGYFSDSMLDYVIQGMASSKITALQKLAALARADIPEVPLEPDSKTAAAAAGK
jgi:hypothetical protein